jgi:type IV secretory pathway TraG/TraD family ATPase VirD4
LRYAIFDGQGVARVFLLSWIEGGVCLAAMLWLAVPADLKRFRLLKYGRVLRGPVMMTPKEFNQAMANTKTAKSDLTTTVTAGWNWFLGKPLPAQPEGIGFKTTEMRPMMRIPKQKEAQHFQLMGDTGAGKTQLIMQVLRQIRDRGDVAIVHDPACEFVQRFYDEQRGDYILNPLDARCPFWGPASEIEGNQEATAVAASLYQPTSMSVKDEFFYRAPAKIFAHLLKEGPDPHQLADWMSDEPELQLRVAGTEMAFFINRKAGPQANGVLASLGMTAESLRLLPRAKDSTREWNAVDWAKERRGWIFITSQLNEREILRPLISLWIDMLVMRLMTVPKRGQKQVWFVIDELASLQKLPQLHTAITESRKSRNPLVLGFQGRAQLQDIYGKLAEVMLSQPATKIFLKTGEPEAAKWISEAIGHVEIERLKETKFDGSRSGKNFTVDRQIEPLVMPSEISGLEDRCAFLKLGNNVARFDFDYLDLTEETEPFIPRNSADDRLKFDRRGFLKRYEVILGPEAEATDAKIHADQANTGIAPAPVESQGAPIGQGINQSPIRWPSQPERDSTRGGSEMSSSPEMEIPASPVSMIAEVHTHLPKHGEDQIDLSLEP